MKKGYIALRLLRSLISLLIIIVIVFTLIYTLIPRSIIRSKIYVDLRQKPQDVKDDLANVQLEKLGYLDYVTISDYCVELYGQGNVPEAALQPDSEESQQFRATYEKKGYTVEAYQENKQLYACKDIPVAKRILTWFGNLIQIDHPCNCTLARIFRLQKESSPGLAI